jgi:hypothetical protein
VLKKAGIIVAASAAGILAFTPLAFAGSKDDGGSSNHKDDKSSSKSHDKDDDGDHHHKGDDGDHHDGDHHDGDDGGDVKKDNLENDCQFGNQGGSPVANAAGGNSVLGVVGLVTSAAIDATSQLNTLNCNNINLTDLVDADSNNDTTTKDTTRVDDSFNADN